MRRSLLLLSLLLARIAAADDERAPPPDPSRGDSYDGRPADPPSAAALFVPRVLLFPLRLTFLVLEPPSRWLTEFEQRHHIGQHIHDLTTSADGKIGVRPELHWSTSFQPSFGARYFDFRSLGYETSLIALGLGGPDVAHGELLVRPTPFSTPVQLTVGAVYDHRADRLFAGLDNTVPVATGQLGPSRYESDMLDTEALVGVRVAAPLVLSFGGSFGWRKFGDGQPLNGDPKISDAYCVRNANGTCVPGSINPVLVPGFIGGTRFLRAVAGITLDLRDSTVHSAAGALIVAGADYSHGLGGDDSSYFRVHGSLTIPITLYRRRHVLLLRGGTQLTESIGNTPIPFSELPTLGGPSDLRGFRDQLLRGHSLFVATAEYRFPVWMWMDAVVFVDYGGVFGPRYAGFGVSHMQPDVGVGLRLFTRDQFWLRVQLAYGWGEGWRFTLSTLSWP